MKLVDDTPRIAAIVIAGQGSRAGLIDDQILPSLTGFDEVLVVGTHHGGNGFRYLHVPDLTKTTNDALVKRDVGALATDCSILVYLADDHRVRDGFAAELRAFAREKVVPWDVLIPARWVQHPEQGLLRIPNGEENFYCAGHGGVFRRRVVVARPWTAQQHHRNWDLISSHDHLRAGFKLLAYPKLQIEDLEPMAEPWK